MAAWLQTPLGRSGDLSRRHAGRARRLWLLTDRFPRLLMIAVVIGSLTSFLGA